MPMMPGRYLSFDRAAGDYDRTRVMPSAQRDAVARLLGREAQLAAGGLFLDAGVGTGRLAAPLAALHPGQVVGADVSGAMMAQVRLKSPPGSIALAQADLQRLPFRAGVFRGVLMVHILHLLERWPLALTEARRVLAPGGTLFLGLESGGRSALVDFYFERARARRALAPSLGAAGLSPALALLRRRERDGGLGASVVLLELPAPAWKRTVPVADTLDALARRTYSQMWAMSEGEHAEIFAETQRYARQTFPKAAAETLPSRFSLYAARWR